MKPTPHSHSEDAASGAASASSILLRDKLRAGIDPMTFVKLKRAL